MDASRYDKSYLKRLSQISILGCNYRKVRVSPRLPWNLSTQIKSRLSDCKNFNFQDCI